MSRPRSLAAALALVTLATAWAPPALADGGAPAPPAGGGAPSPQRPEPSGRWGWLLVVPSLAAGAALLAYGLSIECAEHDTGCQRGAGAAIWGSVGIASVGSLLGISIVQAGRAAALASPPAPAPPARAAGSPLPALMVELRGELP